MRKSLVRTRVSVCMSYSYFLLHLPRKNSKKKDSSLVEITGGTEEVLAIERGIFLTLLLYRMHTSTSASLVLYRMSVCMSYSAL